VTDGRRLLFSRPEAPVLGRERVRQGICVERRLKRVHKKRRVSYGTAVVAMALLAVCLWRIVTEATATPSCTIFTAVSNGQVLFGNNEDHHQRELLVGFRPASSEGYGAVYFGHRRRDGTPQYEGAVNQFGLAWDINSAPRARLNPQAGRARSKSDESYFGIITRRATTAEGAIRIAKDFDFGDSMAYQIHIADASGDAVIIGAGADGELAFTRIARPEGHLVSTNFNRADYKASEVGWRYETAMEMLGEVGGNQSLTPGYATSVLNAVHLNMLTTYTLYSNVVDLPNKAIYLNYMSQYGETAILDIAEELAKGARVVSMRELFSAETASAGDIAYGRFERRFTSAKVGVVATGVAILGGTALLVLRLLRRRLDS